MHKYLFSFVTGILLVASCTKEAAPDTVVFADREAGLVEMSFVANAEGLQTRADIDGNFVLWESGDEIAVFDGSAFNRFTASSVSADGKSAQFSGSAQSADGYWAVAPYSSATNISTENSRISIKIPGTQTVIGSRCVDPGALVSTASDNGSGVLTFTNQFSLMKVRIDRSDVASVTLTGNNGESINGTNHFYYGGEGAPRMDYSNAAGYKITLVYKADAGSENSAFPAGEYYIALWPNTFEKGYSIIVTTTDGSKSIKTKSSPQSLVRNGGQNLSVVDDGTPCPPVIMNADQLKMWRRLASAGVYAEGDEVKLGADIDLGGYAWKPVEQFLGIFDGQGHKIYNFTVSNPSDNRIGFIRTLGSSAGQAAVLKDVVFGSSDGSSPDGSSSIQLSNPTADSWSYAGVIGYAHKNSLVENVSTFIPVTASSDVTTRHAVAGIAGAAGEGATLKSCVNYADITDNAACETKEDSAVGGILGSTGNADVSLLSCSNEGILFNNCIGVSCIGGIVGKSSGTGMLVQECSNTANIINAAPCVGSTKGNWDISIGGIMGLMGNTTTVDRCTNSGVLHSDASLNADYDVCYGGIVGATTKNGSVIKGCTNSAEICYEDKEFASYLAAGGILGYSRGSVTITKADDGTLTTNTGQYFQRRNHGQHMYVGGIAGLVEKQESSVIEFCSNEGRIVGFGDQTSTKKEFYAGGICGGADSGTIRDCINAGFLIARDGDHIAYFGGIAGSKNKYPASVLRCVNNGAVSGYNSSGSTRAGGLLAVFQPDKTEVRDCVSNCLITTGNVYTNASGNTAGEPVYFQNKDYYKGGLFGEVLVPKADVTDNVTGCVVNCTLSNKSASKDGWTGIIAGQTKSTSSTAFKLIFGTASDPVLIVNTCKIEYGSDANPAEITPGDVINTEANACKWLMGAESKLYDAASGSSNKGIVDFNFQVVSAAQAGIE